MTPSRESDGIPAPASLRRLGHEGYDSPGPDKVKVHVNTFEGIRLVIDTEEGYLLLDLEPAVAAYISGGLAAGAGVMLA